MDLLSRMLQRPVLGPAITVADLAIGGTAVLLAVLTAVLALLWLRSLAQGRSLQRQVKVLSDLGRAQLFEAIEALPEAAALFDAEDRLVFRNGRFLDVNLPVQGRVVAGMRFEEMLQIGLAAGLYQGIPPGGEEHWIAMRLANHRNPQGSIVIELPGDRWFRVDDHRMPGGGTMSVRTDITDLRRRERALLESRSDTALARARLEEAVEALSEGFVYHDAQDRLVLCNSKLREFFRRSASHFMPGRLFEDLLRIGLANGDYAVAKSAQDDFIAWRMAAHRNPGSPIEVHLADGRWVQVSERRTRDGGIVGVGTDITALKRAEAAMQAALALAEEANQAKSRFLAAASHDLRQPLHALGMFVAVLRQRIGKDRRVAELVDNICASLGALESLLNALLDISKLDAGVINPEIADLPLAPMLSRLRVEYGPQASNRGLELRMVNCNAVVRSDPALLESLVRNLVSNALRYTENGRVLIGCRRRDGKLSLQVHDTGIGIPADQIQLVFHEFYRLDSAPARASQGAGLGLAIVDRVARLLCHRVSVTSRPGRGSMFAVELPLASNQAVSLAAQPVAEAVADPLDGRSLLVIDDDLAVLEGMRRLLEGWGCRVLIATSADQALSQLRDFGVPDLIVADYRLRHGTGFEAIGVVCKRLGSSVPAVIVTGDPVPLPDGAGTGFHVLRKPVHPAKLRSLLSFSMRADATRGSGHEQPLQPPELRQRI